MLTMAFFWTAVETRNNSTTNSCKQHFTEVGADFFLAQSVDSYSIQCLKQH